MLLTRSLRNRLSRVKRRLFPQDNGAAILLYHRVAELESDPQLLAVSPANFESQIRHLQAHYHLLSVEEFHSLLMNKKELPRKSVLITFDDGYVDNYQVAAPVLEKCHAQALFYICTGNINTNREFWWDALERIILLSDNKEVEIDLQINEINLRMSIRSSADRENLYNRLTGLLKGVLPEQRQQVINYLSEKFGSAEERADYRCLTTAELKEFDQMKSVVIGAHTRNHVSLGQISPELQEKEIAGSKSFLEDCLGHEIKYFSYPFGTRSDYNQDSIRICQELGFSFAMSNFPGLADKKTGRFELPRHIVRDWDKTEFEYRMRGFFA